MLFTIVRVHHGPQDRVTDTTRYDNFIYTLYFNQSIQVIYDNGLATTYNKRIKTNYKNYINYKNTFKWRQYFAM